MGSILSYVPGAPTQSLSQFGKHAEFHHSHPSICVSSPHNSATTFSLPAARRVSTYTSGIFSLLKKYPCRLVAHTPSMERAALVRLQCNRRLQKFSQAWHMGTENACICC